MCENKTVLKFGLLFPLQTDIGVQRATAALMAIDHINEQDNLLPNYILVGLLGDAGEENEQALQAAIYLSDQGAVGFVGPSKSAGLQLVKVVSELKVLPLITYAATGVNLAAKNDNLLFRNVPGDAWQVNALLDMCLSNNWTNLLIIGAAGSSSVSSLFDTFLTTAPAMGITPSAQLVNISSATDIRKKLQRILDTKIKIIALAADPNTIEGIDPILALVAEDPVLSGREFVWLYAGPRLALDESAPFKIVNLIALRPADLASTAFLEEWASGPAGKTAETLANHSLTLPTGNNSALLPPDLYALAAYDAVIALAKAYGSVGMQTPGLDLTAGLGLQVASKLRAMAFMDALTGPYRFATGSQGRETPLSLMQAVRSNWTERSKWYNKSYGFASGSLNLVWEQEPGHNQAQAPYDRFCQAEDVVPRLLPCDKTGLRHVTYNWNEASPCRADHVLAYTLPSTLSIPCDTFSSKSYGAIICYALTAVLLLLMCYQGYLLWSVHKQNLFYRLNPYYLLMIDLAAVFGIAFVMVNRNEVTDYKCFVRPGLFLISYCLGQGSLLSMGYQEQLNQKRGFTYVQHRRIVLAYLLGSAVVLIFGMRWALVAPPRRAQRVEMESGGAAIESFYCANSLNSLFPFLIFLALFVTNVLGLILAFSLRRDTRLFSWSRYISRCLLVLPLVALVAGFLTYMSTGTRSSYVLLTFQNLGCLFVFLIVISELTRYVYKCIQHVKKGELSYHEMDSLKQVLESPVLRTYMLKFMQSRHMSESMEFLIALQVLDRISDSTAYDAFALDMYETFIQADSPKELNLSDKIREEIKIALVSHRGAKHKAPLSRDIFGDIREELMLLIKSNAFIHFISSEFSSKASAILDWVGTYDTFDKDTQKAVLLEIEYKEEDKTPKAAMRSISGSRKHRVQEEEDKFITDSMHALNVSMTGRPKSTSYLGMESSMHDPISENELPSQQEGSPGPGSTMNELPKTDNPSIDGPSILDILSSAPFPASPPKPVTPRMLAQTSISPDQSAFSFSPAEVPTQVSEHNRSGSANKDEVHIIQGTPGGQGRGPRTPKSPRVAPIGVEMPPAATPENTNLKRAIRTESSPRNSPPQLEETPEASPHTLTLLSPQAQENDLLYSPRLAGGTHRRGPSKDGEAFDMA
eukprot:g27768.t1